MPGSTNRIVVVQLRQDVLAAALADAIRRERDLVLIEPAPCGPDRLDALLSDLGFEPVVVLVGQPPSLETKARSLANKRPALVIVTVPVGEPRLGLNMPEFALEKFVALLRSLVRGGLELPAGGVEPEHPALPPTPTRPLLPPPTDGGPGPLCQAWLDAVLRLAIAGAAMPDDTSLPGLTVSLPTAMRLLSRTMPADRPELATLAAERDQAEARLADALASGEAEQRLSRLVNRLGLRTIEWQTLLLLLAPELDPLYQRVYGVLHDDLGRRSASLGLVGTVLCAPGQFGSQNRRVLAETGGLARWWLTQPWLGPAVAASDPLQVDPAIRAWLIEGKPGETGDPALAGWLRDTPWPGAAAVTDLPETARLTDALRNETGWVVLTGGYDGDWRAAIETAAARTSRSLLRITPDRNATVGPRQAEEIAMRISRATRLFDMVPAIAVDAATDPAMLTPLIANLASAERSGPAVLLAADGASGGLPSDAASIVLPFTPMTNNARAALFQSEAARAGITLGNDAAAQLAISSRLPASMVAQAMTLARAKAAGQTGGVSDRDVAAAFRQVAMPHLPIHARLLTPVFDIAQVVLPIDGTAQLNEIIDQCRHAGTVLEQWGFGAQLPVGRGVVALFWGPSGTGKTMAAQAVARALDTDIFLVDLARVVSKYIGETEKNLDSVFDEAERAGVVLLFDEADALFAKRGEVRDAHDRYANVEVAFLLQRLESFAGLAILTTNFRQNIDTAFVRRIRFAIEFPRPDAAAREAIWRQCLPASAPLAHDVDFGILARRIELTGGNIRQVTLRAAFAAAAAREPISMRHLLAAARAELLKIGMPTAAAALPLAVKANAA